MLFFKYVALKGKNIMANGVSDMTLKRCMKEVGITELDYMVILPQAIENLLQ